MKAEIRYTRPILKSAITAYIKRIYLKHLLAPSLAAVVLLLCFSFLNAPWLQSFALVTVLTVPVMVVWGYWMRIRHSLKILDLLEEGKVEINLSEEGVSTSSSIGQTFLKWSIFTELWDTPDSKLLVYTNNQFLTLPKNQVPEAFFHLIADKLKKS